MKDEVNMSGSSLWDSMKAVMASANPHPHVCNSTIFAVPTSLLIDSDKGINFFIFIFIFIFFFFFAQKLGCL